jgi:hypothetical protein
VKPGHGELWRPEPTEDIARVEAPGDEDDGSADKTDELRNDE